MGALLILCTVPSPLRGEPVTPAPDSGRTESAAERPHPDPNPLPPGKPYQVGTASVVSKKFHGRRTASGQRHDAEAFTAAHRSLPMGTKIRVTHLKNHKSVVVTVNDRGPFVRGRIVDLSIAAARVLGMTRHSLARVRIDLLRTSRSEPSGR